MEDKLRKLFNERNYYTTIITIMVYILFSNFFYSFTFSTGSSMEPTMYGMTAQIMDVHSHDYEVGDIVSYKIDPDKPCWSPELLKPMYKNESPNYNCLLHRIVKVHSENAYMIQGDNNDAEDMIMVDGHLTNYIPKSHIIGEVVWYKNLGDFKWGGK